MEDNTRQRKILWSLAVVAVLVYALIPVIWIISLSLKTPETIGDGRFIPSHWTLDNYSAVFNTGFFTARSRDVPTLVAKGEYSAGFAVPSYMAFEEKLAGFDLKFVAPKNAFVTPEPMAILAGARNPKAAKAFVEFLRRDGVRPGGERFRDDEPLVGEAPSPRGDPLGEPLLWPKRAFHEAFDGHAPSVDEGGGYRVWFSVTF